MDIAAQFRVDPKIPRPVVLDLLAEAMTSCTPPIDPVSIAEIRETETRCLGGLQEDDCVPAVKIFEALDRLPPLQSWVVKEFLNTMEQYNFDLEALAQGVRGSKTVADSVQHPEFPIDELGFCRRPAEFGSFFGEQEVELDQQRAEREGFRVIGAITDSFSRLADRDACHRIAESCRVILALRMQFEFTAVEPQS